MKVDHIGIVVKNIEEALPAYTQGLGLHLEKVQDMPGDRVRIAFLPTAAAEIELVQPTDDASGVAKFLAARGEGIHHICLEVSDIRASLRQLAEMGLELIDQEPRPGAGGQVAFVHPKSMHGVLVELLQKT
ncbi:MAG: methylmalonyl-CoA epimerase [Chloroflexota bacterium]|nr:methylmalonyl-CoA epimerase [Chloroflexota bacterium]